MNIDSDTQPPWVLIAKNSDGEEVEGGRFWTDFQAAQYARDRKIREWRLKGPSKSVLSSSTSA